MLQIGTFVIDDFVESHLMLEWWTDEIVEMPCFDIFISEMPKFPAILMMVF